MNFRTWSTRSGVSHHPEIIFLVAINYMHIRIKTGPFKYQLPMLVSFLIKLGRVPFARHINSRKETGRRKSPPINKKFPSPFDGLFFEVITERPITQHLEECLVICIKSNIIKIIMLASCTDALLRISCPRRFIGCLLCPKKERYELIHPSISEQEPRRFR